MKKDLTLSIRELKAYARKKKVAEWVFAFLDGVGINKPMAKGIMRRKEEGYHSWIGPINFPLEKLIRCCGPEKSMEFYEDINKWNKRVRSMVREIEKGWEAPVLIANPRDWPVLSVRDGNHRHEALIRSGYKKYWTIFWFDNPQDRQKFRRKYKDYLD